MREKEGERGRKRGKEGERETEREREREREREKARTMPSVPAFRPLDEEFVGHAESQPPRGALARTDTAQQP